MISMREKMDSIDKKLVKILEESDEPLTTYKVAKETKHGWSTVRDHLKDLVIMDRVEYSREMRRERMATLWKLKE